MLHEVTAHLEAEISTLKLVSVLVLHGALGQKGPEGQGRADVGLSC